MNQTRIRLPGPPLLLLVLLTALVPACGTLSRSPSPSPAPMATPLPLSPEPTAIAPSPTATTPVQSTPTPPPPTSTSAVPAGPSPTPRPTLTPAPPPVAVWEGTVSLDTYNWEDALVPTTPDDSVYPYPRLDFDALTGPAPRTYQAVFVQNEYVQLVILPELGGRILRWTDRTTGRQLLYANPVVKPTRWGYRGWWLATGGIEWAFPTEEHGLNEYRPWEYQLLWNGVRIWDTEEQTGMKVEVTLQLTAGSSRVSITPRITNPTAETQSFQFWANAMLTLSDANAPSPDLTFILPADEVIIHSTGDGSLPEPRGRMTWPAYAGRDFSRYPEWTKPLGVFAPQAADAGFAGAYDLGVDQGIVRTGPAWVRGVKIFCLGDLGSELWTDDASRYFELWTGLTPTFWHYTTLEPGESVGWSEDWYAVSGMDGYTFANAAGAARVTPTGGGVEVAAVTTCPVQATVVLTCDGAEVARWSAPIGPAQPFRTTTETASTGACGLRVLDPTGAVLIEMGP